MERTFIDTNILLYADDADAGEKQESAREALRRAIAENAAVVSTQVLQEYFVVATRKLGMEPGAARARVELYSRLDVVLVRSELILAAIDLHRLNSVSFWDALVVTSASHAGCSRVWSEDFNTGQVISGVRLENPLR